MGNTAPTPKSTRPRSIQEFEIKYAGVCRSSHNQRRLKEGICHGMCLDWVRAMIHQTGARFVDYKSMELGSLTKVYAMEQRIHNAYNLVGKKLIEAALEEGTRLRVEAQRKHEISRRANLDALRLLDHQEELARQIKTGSVSGESLEKLMKLYEQVKLETTTAIDTQERLVTESEKFAKRVEQMVAKLNHDINDDERMFHHFYDYFREHFSEWVEGDPMDVIVAGTGSYEAFSGDTLDQWFTRIRTCLVQLKDGHAALLNFRRGSDDPQEPGAGHYVAFYRSGTTYHFFDPNSGWYAVRGVDAIMELFKDLWFAVYSGSNYRKSIWRNFYHMLQPEDPHLPLGHAIL